MKSRLVLVLLAVILVPAGALALLGARTFRGEAERARARLRERAEQAVDAVRAGLADELERVARGEELALSLRVDAEGRLLEPRLERPWPEGPWGPMDPALYRFLDAEVDRLADAGEVERAAERLREVGGREEDPWLAAWAWSTLGALERHAGREAEARAAFEELVTRYPYVRDERGLVRSFAARRFLAETTEELLALYTNVLEDHNSNDEVATRAFKADLERTLAARSVEEELDGLRWIDRMNERVRRFRSAWREGIGDWIGRGAPGGAARFGEWVVVAAAPSDEEGRGGALETRRLVETTLARPEIATFEALGFETVVTGLGDDEARGAGALALARRDLATPFSGLAVSVFARDMATLLQRERRDFLLIAGLVGAGILFSLVAGITTVRAIGREVEAARGREAFVAAVTHELKAPLASIRLLGEVLGEGDVEEAKVREFGQRTAAEAERLSQVITSVLELARLEHDPGSAPAHESVDLNDVARDAVATFEPLARERGFGLELRESSGPLEVQADETALGGALLNLLDNACKYSDEPHTIEVEVNRSTDGRRAEFVVLDRGRGVAPREAEAIFEPFRRVGDELTRDRPGVGLGLALVRRIARAHGGDAQHAPRDGGGSRFTIVLPVRKEVQ